MDFIDLKPSTARQGSIDSRIQRCSTTDSTSGPEVAELEERLAAYVGASLRDLRERTEALLIALMALGIKPGDEVITTPVHLRRDGRDIVLLGAKPVCRRRADTCNIDRARLEAAITPRTRAIMPVALYGQPADMDEINAIAAKHGLAVIEDARRASARAKRRKSCDLSTIGCTSFFPSKPLGCYGDGGAIFTDDDELAAGDARDPPVTDRRSATIHTRLGVSGRMDTIQCAVLLAKLERFDWEIEQRRVVAKRYDRLLAGLEPAVRTLTRLPDRPDQRLRTVHHAVRGPDLAWSRS